MEVITGAEGPEYLRGPYVGKEGIAGATIKNIATPIRNGTRIQQKGQDNHKCLEKSSENVELETGSEEAKTSQKLVGPQRGQVVQVWFGKEKKPEGQ